MIDKTVVSVRLTPELSNMLTSITKSRGLSKNSYVIMAIVDKLKKEGVKFSE